jgi:putative DNA methylase
MTPPRLIERGFPLRQTSLDSVHEKNVRHGHISTLHIWPARRPLAACRAALIATLLPDPGNLEERNALLKRIGGTLKKNIVTKKRPDGGSDDIEKDETQGGVLHWGRETSTDMDWLREQILAAYGGRAPRVLDPFAGGGAIPLEAMRLGCDVTAVDINPVAWFILKCTLEYPQRLAGQTHPLPDFYLESEEYRERKGRKEKQKMFSEEEATENLAEHVRAWGWWVLKQARADLERFYPTVDDKPTVAYLWARTVRCKNCRAIIPLLKTRWLAKKSNKRVSLTMVPNDERTGVVFGIQQETPRRGGNGTQQRTSDTVIGQGTMSRKGAWCPCCGKYGTVAMTIDDIRYEARQGRMGAMMTAVVVDGPNGKEYRLPTDEERKAATDAEQEIERVFADIPFGLPEEPMPKKETLGFRVPLYGFDQWYKLFTPRQLLALGTFVKHTRAARETMRTYGYSEDWVEGVGAYLALAMDKSAQYCSAVCSWHISGEKMRDTFARFALPVVWDFTEIALSNDVGGSYTAQLDWITRYIEHALTGAWGETSVQNYSATRPAPQGFDAIVTDPPYYDAIGYAALMDFFYVWLRRTLHGLSPEIDAAFSEPLAPKWNHETNDGELIDDASRFGGDKQRSKAVYEEGMFRVFQACWKSLNPDGRLVIVFANKQPDAWETLVSAIIRAGFIVTGSWPIQTEMANRPRALSSAALASSIWLVCKKRPPTARVGWDTVVLGQMHEQITQRLRDFWDAGIRGPDFVWSATGPALESYSKHPAVKKANQPGELMPVPEFLGHVRRMVVDFVVGRVLSQGGEHPDTSDLDDVTTYYLLHRNDFGLEPAPAGACILYALSCNLSDHTLSHQFDVLVRGQAQANAASDSEDAGDDETTPEPVSGNVIRLKGWEQRTHKGMGYDAPAGHPIPLIDQIHRLMHLWKAGDVVDVDEYLNLCGLRRNAMFLHVLQSLIELAPAGNGERSLLESISNHVAARGTSGPAEQMQIELS